MRLSRILLRWAAYRYGETPRKIVVPKTRVAKQFIICRYIRLPRVNSTAYVYQVLAAWPSIFAPGKIHATSSTTVTVCRDSLAKKVVKNRGNTAHTSINYCHCQHTATCLTATPRKLVEVANRKGNRCCSPPCVKNKNNTLALGLHYNSNTNICLFIIKYFSHIFILLSPPDREKSNFLIC